MLFFVRFDVTQPANVSNEQLIATWIRGSLVYQRS